MVTLYPLPESKLQDVIKMVKEIFPDDIVVLDAKVASDVVIVLKGESCLACTRKQVEAL